jgi:thiol-disulfide isomerase/thioredoxin
MEIVYIGAHWCSPCRVIKPQIEAICKKFSVPFKALDYDDDLDDEGRETIQKVPTIRIFVKAVKAAEFNTAQVANTEAWLRAHIKLDDADF